MPTPGIRTPYANQWAHEITRQVNTELLRREPLLLGYRYDGTNLHLRFRSAYAAPWVQVHVQATGTVGTNYVVNGAFAADVSWTKGSNWQVTGGTASLVDTTNPVAQGALTQNVGSVNGQQYKVTFTTASRTQGSITPTLGGTAGTAVSDNSTSAQIITAGAGGVLSFSATAHPTAWDGTIDNVSVELWQSVYTPSIYSSSTEYDCRATRIQDVSVTDVAAGSIVYLIPVQYDGAGTKILFDGQSGRPDNMVFLAIDGKADTLSSITADYTATIKDEHLIVDASNAAVTVTLPAASSSRDHVLHVKKVDSTANAVTIDGNGAEQIDGATTAVINIQYDSLRFVCDGTAWHIT